MEINWKIKSKIFSLIDYFKLNFFLYLFQKYITGNSFKKSNKYNPLWEFHKKSIETHKSPSITTASIDVPNELPSFTCVLSTHVIN